MSRVGKNPINIPGNVKFKIDGRKVHMEGPLGKLDYICHDRMTLEVKDNQIVVKRKSDNKFDRSLHGLTRSLINNMVTGVTTGFSKQLDIEGVGFKAQLKGKTLSLALGFSHPVDYPIPVGITMEVPKPTIIIVKGIDKSQVGQVAADIRDYYKPEPYKGKGIRYTTEHVRRKQGKKIA